MKTKGVSKVDIKELEKAFKGDLDLVLFFVSWIKHGRNATEAYAELNPTVDRNSAQVLGSRQLAKIDRLAVMKSYGLGLEEYFEQLGEGLKATKWNDFTGEREADHTTRKPYHDKLGRLLGVEQDKGISISGDKVIAILGGATKEDVSINNSNQEVAETNQEN